ncbi:MAG: PKD domain-containing protein [Thermoplasmata archaeon]|nr:PKD domain-containing protein [Thermoplasmata archaeon]
MRSIKQKRFFGVMAVLASLAVVSSAFSVVEGIGPHADFYWEPAEPTDMQVVNFHDNSSGGAIVWVWDFGDGNSSCDRNPSHMYADNGVYTVRLTVWDSSDVMDTVTKTINVSNVPPVADAGGDRILRNMTVNFNASSSYDADGHIASYSWAFGDGAIASGVTTKHKYGSDGTYNVTLNITDNDGAYDTDAVQITVDTADPLTNATFEGNEGTGGWYMGNVTVALNASDNLSGVNSTHYRMNNGSWNVYNGSFIVSTEAANVMEYYSVDNAGNIEATRSADIKIDITPPETNYSLNGTLGKNGWYVSDVNITFNASDSLSGTNYTKYKIDDGDWETYGGGIEIGSSGSHKIYFYSVDNAGNVEAEANFTFKIDKDAPSTSITVPRDGYIYIFGREIMPTILGKTKVIGKLTATATAADTLSGIQSVYFKIDGDLLWMDFNAPYGVELPRAHPRGVHTLTVTAYDNAGNSATTSGIEYIKIF